MALRSIPDTGTAYLPTALQTMLRLSADAGLGMTAADIAGRFRVYAAHCVELAKATSEFTNKLVLLEMARAWLDLADQAKKNGESRHRL